MSLLSVAIQMNQSLPWPTSDSRGGSDTDVAVRVRTCAAWAVHNLNMYAPSLLTHFTRFSTLTECRGCMMGLYQPAAPIDSRLGITPNLPDEVRSWSAFPKGSLVYDFRPNVLLRERCMLFRLCFEMTHLLFGDQRPSDVRCLHKAIQSLDERFQQWRDNLPTDLRYDQSRPLPIYELQYARLYSCSSDIFADLYRHSVFTSSAQPQSCGRHSTMLKGCPALRRVRILPTKSPQTFAKQQTFENTNTSSTWRDALPTIAQNIHSSQPDLTVSRQEPSQASAHSGCWQNTATPAASRKTYPKMLRAAWKALSRRVSAASWAQERNSQWQLAWHA